MDLTLTVYIILIAVALLVIAYWISYTHRLKTLPHTGTQEGLAMDTRQKGRS